MYPEMRPRPDIHLPPGDGDAAQPSTHPTAGPRPADRRSGLPSPSRRRHVAEPGPIVIDCAACSMHGIECGDCVVTFLMGELPDGVVLADEEKHALDVLAGAGLVPPLRLVSPVDSIEPREPEVSDW